MSCALACVLCGAARAAGRGRPRGAGARANLRVLSMHCIAEKALCHQEKLTFRKHLMPYQVGVAVAGGLNMWCTVVECLLQCDPRNVMVAVDLENCFNAIERDALVEELRRHTHLRPLARYVINAYPVGMVSVARIGEEWRRLCTERGPAQGRPLAGR